MTAHAGAGSEAGSAARVPGAGDPGRVAGLVLAAGSGTRFGGGKVRAMLDGRPLLSHVLGAARAAGLGRLIVVLGRDAEATRAAVLADDPAALEGVLILVNPAPERGLASSIRLGLPAATAEPIPEGVVVLLGDQPHVRANVIRALVAAAVSAPAGGMAVVPSYARDGAPNPTLLLPVAWRAIAALEGDRGFGPILAMEPGRVVRVPVDGSNPDIDTPADLAALTQGRS